MEPIDILRSNFIVVRDWSSNPGNKEVLKLLPENSLTTAAKSSGNNAKLLLTSIYCTSRSLFTNRSHAVGHKQSKSMCMLCINHCVYDYKTIIGFALEGSTTTRVF
jgi:hypothetical protein